MKITVLVENTTSNPKIKAKHGISLYIETKQHKILFDTGSNDLYRRNAKILGIDLKAVDTLVISHGHIDHGGALRDFLAENKTARIYIHRDAFDSHYVKVAGIKFNVGLEQDLKNDPRIVMVDSALTIDDELTLFSEISSSEYIATSNKKLYAKKQGKVLLDDFSHEQCMIVTENGRSTLFAGCSHKGIWNYVCAARKFCISLTSCIGGFHLYNPPTRKYESNELIDSLGKALKETEIKYFTCHCTGLRAYSRMKLIMNDNLEYLRSGDSVEI